MVFATVPAAPPTWKKRRATSWPAPISAKVPYFFASRFIWNAFLSVPRSISAFIRFQDAGHSGASQPGMRSKPRLHPHAFGAARRDPAALIVRQRGVNPIAAFAQDLYFAAGRQKQNALGVVRRRKPGLGFFRGHDRQRISAGPIFQRENREHRYAADRDAGYDKRNPSRGTPAR